MFSSCMAIVYEDQIILDPSSVTTCNRVISNVSLLVSTNVQIIIVSQVVLSSLKSLCEFVQETGSKVTYIHSIKAY
jgi:hypothetical protein